MEPLLQLFKPCIPSRDISWLEAAQENHPNDDQFYIKAIDELSCDIDIEHLKDLRSYLTKQAQSKMLWSSVNFFQDTLSSQDSNNADLFNYLIPWYQSSFDISSIDIRKNSLYRLVLIQKNPLSNQSQRKWAESKILELFDHPEIKDFKNIEILTEYFLDKNRPAFTNKVLESTVEKHLLDVYKEYIMIEFLLKKSVKYQNDLLWQKCEPQIINSYLDFQFESCPWYVGSYNDEDKARYSTHHQLMDAANQFCKHQEPRPFDINKFNLQRSGFYIKCVMPKLSPILSILGNHNAIIPLLMNLTTNFYFYQKNQMKMPKHTPEYTQETKKALKYFEKKYNYKHPRKLICEGYIEHSEYQGPFAYQSGKIVLPPSPQCDLFFTMHEISHQYHGDLQMLPMVILGILSADYIYSTSQTRLLSIMLPVLIIPIQKSCEKRADHTALACLKTIDEKKECIANLLVVLLRTYPFNREIVSPPAIALHTYPNGIQRILRLCCRAGINYEKDFLPYFAEKHCHAYNKFKRVLQPRATTFIDRLLSIPGLTLNFLGDTMTLLMSTFFQPIRPIIRSENAIKASDFIDEKIHSSITLTQNVAFTASYYIEQEILKRI